MNGATLIADDAVDLEEARQKLPVEHAAADRRLQVEAEERDDLGDPAAVIDQRVVLGCAGRQAEEAAS